MAETQLRRLVCSNHPKGKRFYLVETDGGTRVRCPECHGEWPNFLKYPVQEIVDLNTGEIYLKDLLTGERVD